MKYEMKGAYIVYTSFSSFIFTDVGGFWPARTPIFNFTWKYISALAPALCNLHFITIYYVTKLVIVHCIVYFQKKKFFKPIFNTLIKTCLSNKSQFVNNCKFLTNNVWKNILISRCQYFFKHFIFFLFWNNTYLLTIILPAWTNTHSALKLKKVQFQMCVWEVAWLPQRLKSTVLKKFSSLC